MKRILLAVVLTLISFSVFATPTTPLSELSWSAVTATMGGTAITPTYNVYCGTTTTLSADTPVNVSTTTWSLPTTLADGTYTCAVTALNGTLEGGYSNTVTFACTGGTCYPLGVPGVPGSLVVK